MHVNISNRRKYGKIIVETSKRIMGPYRKLTSIDVNSCWADAGFQIAHALKEKYEEDATKTGLTIRTMGLGLRWDKVNWAYLDYLSQDLNKRGFRTVVG